MNIISDIGELAKILYDKKAYSDASAFSSVSPDTLCWDGLSDEGKLRYQNGAERILLIAEVCGLCIKTADSTGISHKKIQNPAVVCSKAQSLFVKKKKADGWKHAPVYDPELKVIPLYTYEEMGNFARDKEEIFVESGMFSCLSAAGLALFSIDVKNWSQIVAGMRGIEKSIADSDTPFVAAAIKGKLSIPDFLEEYSFESREEAIEYYYDTYTDKHTNICIAAASMIKSATALEFVLQNAKEMAVKEYIRQKYLL